MERGVTLKRPQKEAIVHLMEIDEIISREKNTFKRLIELVESDQPDKDILDNLLTKLVHIDVQFCDHLGENHIKELKPLMKPLMDAVEDRGVELGLWKDEE